MGERQAAAQAERAEGSHCVVLSRTNQTFESADQTRGCLDRLGDLFGVERNELDVVPLLAIVEKAVVELAQFHGEKTGLHQLAMDSGAHAGVLDKSPPLGEEDGAGRIEGRVVTPVDREGQSSRTRLVTRRRQALLGLLQPVTDRFLRRFVPSHAAAP